MKKFILEVNENQLDLIHSALCEYQDVVYDENSYCYDEQDASDFSELQFMIESL